VCRGSCLRIYLLHGTIMWETRLFLPALLSVSLATHRDDLLNISAFLNSSDAATDAQQLHQAVMADVKALVDDVLGDSAEERSDLYAVLPQRSGELMKRVGLKLRSMKKKVEVKIATDIVVAAASTSTSGSSSPAVVVAAKWPKFETKLEHGFGKPKKVVSFLQDTQSPFALEAADQLVAARRLKKRQGSDDEDEHERSNASPFERFPKFPLPLVVVAKARRLSSATLKLGADRRVFVTVEETSVQLIAPLGSIALTSWAVESEDQGLVESIGRYWATWVANSFLGGDAESGSTSLHSTDAAQRLGIVGVMSYPEAVGRYFLNQARTGGDSSCRL
jgi:hypothetical protein